MSQLSLFLEGNAVVLPKDEKLIEIAEAKEVEIITEIWKPVSTLPGYSVSNFGKVKSDRYNKILSYYPDQNGYPQVSMSYKNKRVVRRVHLIVAKEFLPNPENLPMVNHKDGNNENPFASNLEWVSAKGNTQHAVKTGLKVAINKVDVEVYIHGKLFGQFDSYVQAALALKIPTGCVPFIMKGGSKKYSHIKIKKTV